MTSFARGSVSTTLRWILLFALVVMMAGLLPLLHIRPAFASYTNTYPWGNARCVDGTNCSTTYNWGYTLQNDKCPSIDPNCLSYPYPNRTNPTAGMGDTWGYGVRNCTSYAAWQIHQVFNINIPSNWGNGATWDTNALKAGYTNDSSPHVGDIAQWNGTKANKYGHVAYVYAVNNGIASYAEYNYKGDGNYLNTYTSASNSQGPPNNYIHIGTISAWPGVGSATFLGTDHLVPGQTLTSSQYILSGNVQWLLIMQSDGNLVEYHYQSAVWASGTSGHPGAYLGVQGDGNIVVYSSSGQALWATGTNGKSLAYLVMQSDGNLVAYNTGSPPAAIWANNKGGNAVHSFYGSDRLYNGQRMTGDYYLRSGDLRYALLMQADGNLVLFGPGYHVLWANGKNGNPGAYLGLQSDGNIVEYSSSGTALWATNTGGKSLSYLIMQNDGNLVAYSTSGSAIWTTNTNGKI